jgi:hypothetical protein
MIWILDLPIMGQGQARERNAVYEYAPAVSSLQAPDQGCRWFGATLITEA